jgi:hypothetical protein
MTGGRAPRAEGNRLERAIVRGARKDLEAASAALALMYAEIDEGRRGSPLADACNVELLHELITHAETLLDAAKAALFP